MSKIIFSGQKGLLNFDLSNTGVLVACSNNSFDEVAKEKGIKNIDAYDLANIAGLEECRHAKLHEIFNELVAVLTMSGKDIVFHDDYGKYRAYELASAFSLMFNIPIYKITPDESKLVEVVPSLDTTARNYTKRLLRGVEETTIHLPTYFSKKQVIVMNSLRSPDNFGIYALGPYGDTLFLIAGFETAQEATDAAKGLNLDVKYSRLYPKQD